MLISGDCVHSCINDLWTTCTQKTYIDTFTLASYLCLWYVFFSYALLSGVISVNLLSLKNSRIQIIHHQFSYVACDSYLGNSIEEMIERQGAVRPICMNLSVPCKWHQPLHVLPTMYVHAMTIDTCHKILMSEVNSLLAIGWTTVIHLKKIDTNYMHFHHSHNWQDLFDRLHVMWNSKSVNHFFDSYHVCNVIYGNAINWS